jgi:hypothetical protein
MAEDGYFCKGCRVQLCHLKKQEYNGLYGTILNDFTAGMERIGVRVELLKDDGSKTTKDLSVRPPNLAVCARNPTPEGEDRSLTDRQWKQLPKFFRDDLYKLVLSTRDGMTKEEVDSETFAWRLSIHARFRINLLSILADALADAVLDHPDEYCGEGRYVYWHMAHGSVQTADPCSFDAEKKKFLSNGMTVNELVPRRYLQMRLKAGKEPSQFECIYYAFSKAGMTGVGACDMIPRALHNFEPPSSTVLLYMQLRRMQNSETNVTRTTFASTNKYSGRTNNKKKKGRKKVKKYPPASYDIDKTVDPPITLPDSPLPRCKHVDDVVIPIFVVPSLEQGSLRRPKNNHPVVVNMIHVESDGRGGVVMDKGAGCTSDIDFGYLAYRVSMEVIRVNEMERHRISMKSEENAESPLYLTFPKDNHNALSAWWKNLHGLECRLDISCLNARGRLENIHAAYTRFLHEHNAKIMGVDIATAAERTPHQELPDELLPSRPEEAYSTNAKVRKVCAHCGKPSTLNICSGCGAVYYCSKKCQLEAWPAHKGACKQRPSLDH